MVTKKIEFHEVEVRFIVRKGSYSAESISKLRENVEAGIGASDMSNIEAEDITVKINGK